MDEKTLTLLLRILAIMREYVGRDAVINSGSIAIRLNKSRAYGRTVRRLVSDNIEWFWQQDIPILATPGQGFFIGSDLEEFLRYYQFLLGLNLSTKRKLSSLKKLCKARGINLEALA